MEVFYVLGGLLALWAVLVALLGIARHSFPGGRGGERIVIGISLLLVAGAIGSAVIASATQEGEHAEAAATGEAAAPEAPAAPPPASAGEELTLSADPGGQLAFDVDRLEAEPGETSLVMDNPSSLQHNVSLEGDGVDEEGPIVGQGGTSTVSADLEPGDYTFYCSVLGHRDGGMEGELIVK